MDDFTPVCSINDIKSGMGYRFEVKGEDVAVFNYKGNIYALSNICPHQHAAIIYDGFLEKGKIICPAHGWEFDLKTGLMSGGNSGLSVYETLIKDDFLYIKVKKRFLNW